MLLAELPRHQIEMEDFQSEKSKVVEPTRVKKGKEKNKWLDDTLVLRWSHREVKQVCLSLLARACVL